jgi:TPR repeat protein
MFVTTSALVLRGCTRLVSRTNLFQKCDRFLEDPLLAENPYEVRSPVSAESFGHFLSVVEGGTPAITSANACDLALLSDEFGFAELSRLVSEFDPEAVSVREGLRCLTGDARALFAQLDADIRQSRDRHNDLILRINASLNEVRAGRDGDPSSVSYALDIIERLASHSHGSIHLTDAANECRSRAAAGDAHAQCLYGICLEFGLGTNADFAGAAHCYEQSAERGDPVGQWRFGWFIEAGLAGERDLKRAAKYYKMSADQGNAVGQTQFGCALEKGFTGVVDLEGAVEFWRAAAAQGNAVGQLYLGRALGNGRGVEKDVGKAAELYRLAAQQGLSDGQCEFGKALAEGAGVDQDIVEAARYYKMAADHGDAQGQLMYAICLEEGKGVRRKVWKAREYYKMAEAQGNTEAHTGWVRCRPHKKRG